MTLEKWTSLGRMLPRDIRERIFEPALGDLARSRLTRGEVRSRLPFAVEVLGTFFRCIPIAVPRLFFRAGRLTRLGRVSAWALAALVTVGLAVANVARAYAEY